MAEIYSPEEDSYLLSSSLEKIIPKIKKYEKLKYLEIGVGSGIQLKTLNSLGIKKENLFGVDINKIAVKQLIKMGFNCIESNLFSNVKGKYDIILFNPPYLPQDDFEPHDSRIATTGGKNGSEIINLFLSESKKYLKNEGRIFLLTSSLTKGIKWNGFNKKLIGKKKIFFEELRVWELTKN